jgi:hypothetical protein|tara:strand:+ start:1501 stop:1917 length:417 start_codon:yes stop_codon:yes gene_type:complete
MKLTNKDILNAQGSLNKLLQEKLPVKVSFELAKLSSTLREPIETFERVRKSLVEKHQVKFEQREDGATIIKSEVEGNVEKFVEEVAELAEQETEVIFTPVKLPERIASTCDKCNHNMDKDLEIEGAVLVALEKFVTVG